MIEVNGLVYSYPVANEATLHGLRFAIEAQEVFGFLGPSGAGKSTTQKILIGLLRGYTGNVRVMGREVGDWGHDYYEQIGVSFELPNHHKRLTALENLQHFGSLYAADIIEPMEVLRWVGLENDAHKRVSEFSKGMKIRLNLARSVLHRPKLLFLDEPTSGLDPVNARMIKDLILRLRNEGATVFLTTHDMTAADQLCDRVAFITSGGIAAIDAPSTFKRRHGRRAIQVEYRVNGALRRAEFPLDGLGQDASFSGLLKEHPIETIHTQETTLENVFIEITGEKLRG